MSRFTLRFIPLLALLFALSAVASADSFQITFTGIGSGTGQFTTDGVCTMCSPGAGLLSERVAHPCAVALCKSGPWGFDRWSRCRNALAPHFVPITADK